MTAPTITIPSVAALLLQAPADLLPAAADLQGWNSDHPVFDQLIAETKPTVIIEAGTWKGRSAAHMAAAAPEAQLFCVDTWLGGIDHVLSTKAVDDLRRDPFGSPRIYHQFLRNFLGTEWAPVADRIIPIQNSSLNGARLLSHLGVQAQLIYIDASHEYADVYADLCAYSQLLAPGGVIFGDDFRSFPGVFAAALRFAHESGRKLEEVDRNYWVLRSV